MSPQVGSEKMRGWQCSCERSGGAPSCTEMQSARKRRGGCGCCAHAWRCRSLHRRRCIDTERPACCCSCVLCCISHEHRGSALHRGERGGWMLSKRTQRAMVSRRRRTAERSGRHDQCASPQRTDVAHSTCARPTLPALLQLCDAPLGPRCNYTDSNSRIPCDTLDL